jgi:hypothetical protein
MDTPAPTRRNGPLIILVFFAATLAIGIATYYIVPGLVLPYYANKPAETLALQREVAAALLAYHADHGDFPPEEPLALHRRENKNLYTTGAYRLPTLRLAALTTPVAYLDWHGKGDPYAIPEQFSPFAGFLWSGTADGARAAVLVSPGASLDFEIDLRALRAAPDLTTLRDRLVHMTYDPTNGLKSAGDMPMLVPAP